MSAFSPELSPESRKRRSDPLAALAVGLGAFVVYLITTAPTVASNDAGRFQIAAPLLGTGHPTGYPTFILAGKLFTFLPFGDVAYRMNLMAAFFGALAVALAYLACRRLGAGRAPAAGASFILAFSATFWSQTTVAEVYSMHAAFILGVMLLLLRHRESGNTRDLLFAGLVYGLSLGNNAGMVLFAPAFLVLLLSGKRRSLSFTSLLPGGVAFIVGLSVYAYVPIRGFAGAWHNYGDPVNNWNDVWRLVSGARFQGLMELSPPRMFANAGDFVSGISAQAVEPFGYALAAAMVLGGAYGALVLFRRDRAVGVALLLGLFCALVYALGYDIDDISVYYLPVYGILSLLLAICFTDPSRPSWTANVPLIVAALVLGLNFAPSDKSDYYAERVRSEQTLQSLPDDAVLYGKARIIPVTYLKEVEGRREDVTLRWLDGGTLERSFEDDVTGGRPVFFISDPGYDEDYLSLVEPLATSRKEDGLIRLTPR